MKRKSKKERTPSQPQLVIKNLREYAMADMKENECLEMKGR